MELHFFFLPMYSTKIDSESIFRGREHSSTLAPNKRPNVRTKKKKWRKYKRKKLSTAIKTVRYFIKWEKEEKKCKLCKLLESCTCTKSARACTMYLLSFSFATKPTARRFFFLFLYVWFFFVVIFFLCYSSPAVFHFYDGFAFLFFLFLYVAVSFLCLTLGMCLDLFASGNEQQLQSMMHIQHAKQQKKKKMRDTERGRNKDGRQQTMRMRWF